MTGIELAERLVNAGLDHAERPAKALLYDTALAGLRAIGGAEASDAWWVPGRLELFGKHTDYAGGRTLVAAVPRGFAFVAAPRPDGEIIVTDGRSGERVSVRRDSTHVSGWRHYVDVVVARLMRNFPGASGGASIAFASDLPRASGMSSSSALVVGVATAVVERRGLAARAEWQRNIHCPRDLASYYACLENGSDFGALVGDEGVGTHGGSEDHAAMLLCVPGCFSSYSFAPMRHVRDVRVPPEWSVVIASSGATAEKTGSAQDAYNRLAEGSRVLLGIWNASEPRCGSLAAALSSSASAPDRLNELIDASSVPGWSTEALRRRLAHFRFEDACVPAAVRALDDADAAALSALSETSQRNAEHLLRQQVSETIALAEEARAAGAFASCSFGAGFGGSVWALVGREGAEAFAASWLARYRHRYPAAGAVSFIAAPGPPVIELGGSR